MGRRILCKAFSAGCESFLINCSTSVNFRKRGLQNPPYYDILIENGGGSVNPIIKWPGGKSGEINKIRHLIPQFDRYIEPFFGGGALYFHLEPEKALINDISSDLIHFYNLVKAQDQTLYGLLMCYNDSFANLIAVCQQNIQRILSIFEDLEQARLSEGALSITVSRLITDLTPQISAGFPQPLVLDHRAFYRELRRMVTDKYLRTVASHRKKPFSHEDLRENLITGFTSGYYMYFRRVFNDIGLKRIAEQTPQYRAANFYFIREYCYGSMFRYNANGEFNIPYGGMSYNRKDMKAKIEAMFCPRMAQLFSGTQCHCLDFDDFLATTGLTGDDFMFLDPPYDTDFSNYEGKDFTKRDQERLAQALKNTPAKFILVIKNTDFIYDLYKDCFNILSFDKQYTYNVRSRNARGAEHLIVTNLPV